MLVAVGETFNLWGYDAPSEPAFESDLALVCGLIIDSAGRAFLTAFPVFGGSFLVSAKP